MYVVNLDEVKTRLTELEDEFKAEIFVDFSEFKRNGRILKVYISRHLYNSLKKARLWKSKQLLATLKNAEYGFEEKDARSRGGKDGIFLLDRTFQTTQ